MKATLRLIAAYLVGFIGVWLIITGLAAYRTEMAAATIINVGLGGFLIYLARKKIPYRPEKTTPSDKSSA